MEGGGRSEERGVREGYLGSGRRRTGWRARPSGSTAADRREGGEGAPAGPSCTRYRRWSWMHGHDGGRSVATVADVR